MKQVLDSNRRVFIHDYDGVHYDYAAFHDIYDFLGDVKVEAIRNFFPDLDPIEAKARGKESYLVHKDGLKAFVDMAVKDGWNEREFRAQLHILYHQIGYKRVMEQYVGVFAPCEETHLAFQSLQGHVRHGILTLSCVDNWAAPLLKKQNLFHFFEPDALIGFADFDFQNKADSTRPLELALERLKARAEESVFIEDTLSNLERAKQLNKRLLTAYVSHGKPLADLPDFVDVQVPKPLRLLQDAALARTMGLPRPTFSLEMQ